MAAVIPHVSKLSPRVIRVLGCNPGIMTLQGTNTYIIGTGKRRVLLDTGDDCVPQYIDNLVDVLKTEGINLQHILISHWHHDHIGGLSNVLKMNESSEPPQVWKYRIANEGKGDVLFNDLKDGQEFNIEGATLKVIHTPGHTIDHVAIHLLEENAIFSGDCILGEGTAVFEDLHDYMNSLALILKLQPSRLYPGHGNIIQEPAEKIQYYISHRIQRENQILQTLASNKSQSLSSEELVKLIYLDTPKNLYKAAEINVMHHLAKLLKENKVVCNEMKWTLKEDYQVNKL